MHSLQMIYVWVFPFGYVNLYGEVVCSKIYPHTYTKNTLHRYIIPASNMAPAHSETESTKDDRHSTTSHGNRTGRGGKHSNNSHGHNDSSTTRPNAQQQQYLKDLVRRHITNNKPSFSHNGTQDLSKYHDFDYQLRQVDYSVLRGYSHRFHLNEDKDNVTLTGMLLQSPLGLHTMTSHYAQINSNNNRVNKQKYVKRCNDHFKQRSVKELDTISQFIYKVKHYNEDFKMTF